VVCLPHKRAVCVCPVLLCNNLHGPGYIRKLKEFAVRGRDTRGFVLCSAGLSVSVKVLAVGNDSISCAVVFGMQGKSTYDSIYTGLCRVSVCLEIRISS